MAEKSESVSTMGRTLLVCAVLVVGVLTNELLDRVSDYLKKYPVIGAIAPQRVMAQNRIRHVDKGHLAYLRVQGDGKAAPGADESSIETTLFSGSAATRAALGLYTIHKRENQKHPGTVAAHDTPPETVDVGKAIAQSVQVTSLSVDGAFLNGRFVGVGHSLALNLPDVGRTELKLAAIHQNRVELVAQGRTYRLDYHAPEHPG